MTPPVVVETGRRLSTIDELYQVGEEYSRVRMAQDPDYIPQPTACNIRMAQIMDAWLTAFHKVRP